MTQKEENTESVLEKLQHQAGLQRWQFAKTYAQTIPHCYFVREWNEPLYQAFVTAVAIYGRDEVFKVFKTTSTYRYLYLGGYRYWICDDVVNRVEVDNIRWDERGWSYQILGTKKPE